MMDTPPCWKILPMMCTGQILKCGTTIDIPTGRKNSSEVQPTLPMHSCQLRVEHRIHSSSSEVATTGNRLFSPEATHFIAELADSTSITVRKITASGLLPR